MLKGKGLAAAAGLAMMGLALPAGAGSGDVVVEAPWARATPPGAASAAGYLIVRNAGGQPERLIAAASPRAGRVQLHETAIVDGVARMRPLPDGLAIPPGETVELRPGGLHLMFRELEDGLLAGQSVPVTLTFEAAGERLVELSVVPLGAGPPETHRHDHGEHR